MVESRLVLYGHESYEGDLFVKRRDITKAARRIGRLVGAHVVGEEYDDHEVARNIIFTMVDRHNEAHPLVLGGVAIGTDLSVTFWSSPHSEHAGLIEEGRRAGIVITHTHASTTSLRMKQMDVAKISADDRYAYLERLNHARQQHEGLPARLPQEFDDPYMPKDLYVATPSPDSSMTTIPVAAYAWHEGELLHKRDVAYPITAHEIFEPPAEKLTQENPGAVMERSCVNLLQTHRFARL
jgi:hypothetical protein